MTGMGWTMDLRTNETGMRLKWLAEDALGQKQEVRSGKLREACDGFEEIFVNMMLKEMRKGIPKAGLFPDSIQKDIYTDLFDQQVAKEIATGKGIGISDMLYERLSERQK